MTLNYLSMILLVGCFASWCFWIRSLGFFESFAWGSGVALFFKKSFAIFLICSVLAAYIKTAVLLMIHQGNIYFIQWFIILVMTAWALSLSYSIAKISKDYKPRKTLWESALKGKGHLYKFLVLMTFTSVAGSVVLLHIY